MFASILCLLAKWNKVYSQWKNLISPILCSSPCFPFCSVFGLPLTRRGWLFSEPRTSSLLLFIVLLNWKHWFQSPWSMRSGNESSSRVLGNISSVSLLGVWLVVRISVGSAPDQSEAFGAGEARPHEALAYALQYGLLWQQMVLMFDVTLLGLLNVESCCTVLYRTVLCHTATLHCYTLFCPK